MRAAFCVLGMRGRVSWEGLKCPARPSAKKLCFRLFRCIAKRISEWCYLLSASGGSAVNNRLAINLACALGLMAASPAWAKIEFLAYEGRNAIHEGQGGNKKTVEGVDFWSNGDPPRRYKVIGAISDRRYESGLYGMIRMSGMDYDVAKVTKEAHGDAVVLEREGEDLLGVGSSASAFGSGNRGGFSAFGSSYSAPVKAHTARYIVITYLPDESLPNMPVGLSAATVGSITAAVPSNAQPPSMSVPVLPASETAR